jgi:hypothetical protein
MIEDFNPWWASREGVEEVEIYRRYAPFQFRPDEGGSRPPLIGRGGGALAGLGARPLLFMRVSGWAGPSGPGPGGGQLGRACPSARRGRLSMRGSTLPYKLN